MEAHITHSLGFADALGLTPDRALDLGSGGGVPGLVLAMHWPSSIWVLLDTDSRRAGFLERAVLELELGDRVRVIQARAEAAAHDPDLRGTFDLVTARSFGAPAVVAECAAGFLRVGGLLVVSDPPEGAGNRWPSDALQPLGLEVRDHLTHRGGSFTLLAQAVECLGTYPRQPGQPTRRPLF